MALDAILKRPAKPLGTSPAAGKARYKGLFASMREADDPEDPEEATRRGRHSNLSGRPESRRSITVDEGTEADAEHRRVELLKEFEKEGAANRGSVSDRFNLVGPEPLRAHRRSTIAQI